MLKEVRNENVAANPLGFDHGTVAKMVAAGICAAGIALVERHHGIAPRTANHGSAVMTADEVAAFLRLDRKTVYDYAGRGVIPCQRLGKRMLFSRDAIELWLRSCCKDPSESSF